MRLSKEIKEEINRYIDNRLSSNQTYGIVWNLLMELKSNPEKAILYKKCPWWTIRYISDGIIRGELMSSLEFEQT